MSPLQQAIAWGYNLRSDDGRNIAVFPWSKCTDEHRRFIKKHKGKILHELRLERKNGPGTYLTEIIPSLLQKRGCNCFEYAARMDQWGPDGCEERFEEIVAHLVDEAGKRKSLSLFGKKPAGIVAERWVRKAISRARQEDIQ